MIVYLMRHGHAGPGPDAERQLTQEGIQSVGRVAAQARRAGVSPALILTSTHARAIQTAEIVARTFDYQGRIEQTAALLPMASPFDAWDDVRTRQPDGDLLIVAHEPLLSALAALLLDAPTLKIKIGTSVMLAVEIENLAAMPNGTLRWMLTPALAQS
jgi:phosphohistidine phosphatase SixA